MANSAYTILIQQTDSSISVQAPMPDSFQFDAASTYEQMLPQGFTNNKIINLGAAILGSRLAVQALTAQLWAGNTESELSVDLEFQTETDPIADVRTPIVNLLKLTMPSIDSSTGMMVQPGPSLDWKKLGSIAGDAATDIIHSTANVGGAVLGGLGSMVSGAYQDVKSYLHLGTTPVAGTLNNANTSANDGANSSIPKALQQDPSLGSANYWNKQAKNKISIRLGNYMYFESIVITNVQQTFTSQFDAITGLPHHAKVNVRFKPFFMLVQSDLDSIFLNPQSSSTPGTNSFGFTMPNGGNAFGFHL